MFRGEQRSMCDNVLVLAGWLAVQYSTHVHYVAFLVGLVNSVQVDGMRLVRSTLNSKTDNGNSDSKVVKWVNRGEAPNQASKGLPLARVAF